MLAAPLLLALLLQASSVPAGTAKEELLAPALAALRANDPATALADLQQLVPRFPQDGRVLGLAGQAALQSGNAAEAVKYFQLALAVNPDNPWHERLGLIQAYALGGQWAAFDKARQQLTEAKKSGDPLLAKSSGFVIEEFTANGRSYRAVQFPVLTGRYKTRYRIYVLPTGAPEPGPKDFVPYFDLESDDVDQAMYKPKSPEKTEANRRYSLDSYPATGSQALMRFYDGEPTYEEVRAAVIGNPKPSASMQSGATKPK